MLARSILVASGLIAGVTFRPASHAAIIRVEPFMGSVQESWEAYPNFNATVDTLGQRSYLSGSVSILAGTATISHPRMGIFEPRSANYSLGSSGSSQIAEGRKGIGLDFTGPQVLPQYVESASITFSTPLSTFGGYWGAATDYLFDPEVIEFRFYDVAGNLVGTDEKPYTRSHLINEAEMIYWGDGQLEWAGWQFITPVKRIEFGGGFIVADFLQANPIPEPSALALSLVASLIAAIGLRTSKAHLPAS
jgi:hypothetical protein